MAPCDDELDEKCDVLIKYLGDAYMFMYVIVLREIDWLRLMVFDQYDKLT